MNFDLTLEGKNAKIQNITGLPSGVTFPYTFTVKITSVSTSQITYYNDIPLAEFPKTFQLSRGAFVVELQLIFRYPNLIASMEDTFAFSALIFVRLSFAESNGGFPLIPNPSSPLPNDFSPTISPGTSIQLIDKFGNILITSPNFDPRYEYYTQTQRLLVLGTTVIAAGATNVKLTMFPYPTAQFAVSNVTVIDNTIYPRYEPIINISPANSPRFVLKEISGCCEIKNPNNTLYSDFFDRGSSYFYGYKQKYNECDEVLIQFRSNFLSHKLEIWKGNQLLDTVNCEKKTLALPTQPLANGVKFWHTKIHWKGFGCGCYQLKIIGKDREAAPLEIYGTIPDSFVAVSEPIQVGHFEKDFVLIEYTNNTNNYNLLYSESATSEKLRHILRVEGWFGFESEIDIDSEVYRTASGKVEKLYESLAKKLNFRTGRLPNYMHEKLIIALSHDEVIINGVSVTADGKYNTKSEKNKLQLRTGEIQLTDNSFFFENEPGVVTIVTEIPESIAQTITFAPLPAFFVVGQSYPLVATSTSGLLVSFSSSNLSVATIVGNVLTVVGNGSTNITASQGGNGTYFPAPPVVRSALVGLDADIQALIVFRADSRNVAGTTLRSAGGIDYVTSYTDAYTGLIVGNSTASQQPVWTSGGWVFDGVNDSLVSTLPIGSTLQTVKQVCVVANYAHPTFINLAGIITIGDFITQFIYLFGWMGGINIISNMDIIKINNVVTMDFLPAPEKKVITDRVNAPVYNPAHLMFLGQDRGIQARTWQGTISDVIMFSEVLTNDQQTRLYNYLRTYHSLP